MPTCFLLVALVALQLLEVVGKYLWQEWMQDFFKNFCLPNIFTGIILISKILAIFLSKPLKSCKILFCWFLVWVFLTVFLWGFPPQSLQRFCVIFFWSQNLIKLLMLLLTVLQQHCSRGDLQCVEIRFFFNVAFKCIKTVIQLGNRN